MAIYIPSSNKKDPKTFSTQAANAGTGSSAKKFSINSITAYVNGKDATYNAKETNPSSNINSVFIKGAPETLAEIKKFLATDLGKSLADMDGNGKIDDNEMDVFIKMKLAKSDSSLSVEDVKAYVENAKNGASMTNLAGNPFSAPPTQSVWGANPRDYGPQFTGGVAGGVAAGGFAQAMSRPSSVGTNPPPVAQNPNSEQNLATQKTKLEGEIAKKKEDITNINNGSAEQVKSASEAVTTSKEKMDEAVKNDTKVSEENKKAFDANNKEIANNDKALSDNASETAKTESSISQTEGAISTLENSLSTLAKPSGLEKDKEKDAKIQQRRGELETQIKDKKSELDTLKKKKEELVSKKKELDTTKGQLDKTKSELQEKINNSCSPETKQAIEDYNKSKENVEKVKAESLKTAQSELDVKVKELNEVDKKLQGAKDKTASSASGGDLIATARKYLGYSEANGGDKLFTHGRTEAWCADFVTHVAKETYGKDLPRGFGSSSVSDLQDWGKQNNRIVGFNNVNAGDVMIQKNNGASHTGYVTAVDSDGTIHTIEGNTADQVAERTYSPGSRGYNKISSFVRLV